MSGNIFCKAPIELCKIALRERLIPEVQIWLTGQLIYSGKAKTGTKTYSQLATICDSSERTVYSKIKSLEALGWVTKNSTNGWLFFKGKKHLYTQHDWQQKRAAMLFREDIPNFEAFAIGAVISNFIKRNKGARTGRLSRGPETPWHPVSLTIVENLFDVKRTTAQKYRKLAFEEGYIEMTEDLKYVNELTPSSLSHLRQNNVDEVTITYLGSPKALTVKTKQLRKKYDKVLLQLPNLILPKVITKRDNI